MECSLPVPFVHGISQARILEQLPFPTPGDLPDPGIKSVSLVPSALADRFFTTVPPGFWPSYVILILVFLHFLLNLNIQLFQTTHYIPKLIILDGDKIE